jgi:hypothetical protein
VKVHLAFVQNAFLREYEKAYVSQISSELRQSGAAAQITVETDPARADIIILLESAEYKTVDYLRLLENDPLIRQHAERVYTVNYDDHPEGLLAGLYTSLEGAHFQPDIHRIWPVLFMNNSLVNQLTTDEVLAHTPTRLFAFAGAESHALRAKLFRLFATPSPTWSVERIDKWYNHTDDDRRRFVNVALDSLFGLCPRGYTSYTNRICEVMALARVPVIIADDWQPFSFESDRPYYIRVPERDLEHLPDILAGQRREAEEYRRQARLIWERNCSPKRRMIAAIECAAQLAATPAGRPSYAAYRERWHSQEFLSGIGWTFRQRVALRLQQHVRRHFPTVNLPGITPEIWQRNAPTPK